LHELETRDSIMFFRAALKALPFNLSKISCILNKLERIPAFSGSIGRNA